MKQWYQLPAHTKRSADLCWLGGGHGSSPSRQSKTAIKMTDCARHPEPQTVGSTRLMAKASPLLGPAEVSVPGPSQSVLPVDRKWDRSTSCRVTQTSTAPAVGKLKATRGRWRGRCCLSLLGAALSFLLERRQQASQTAEKQLHI